MRLLVRLLTPVALLFAMLLPAGGATADPAFTQRSFGGEFHVNLCNGELLAGFGFGHSTEKLQNDGTFFIQAIFHGQGVGDQGNEYVINQVVHQVTSPTSELALSFRTLLISKGSAPDEVLIITVDPDGNFSVETDCKG
jgi:hypothetical protein